MSTPTTAPTEEEVAQQERERRQQEERRRNVVEGLRAAADFLEARPGMPGVPWRVNMMPFVDGDELREIARLIGKADKVSNEHSYGLKREFGNGRVVYEVTTNRENVCEKRVLRTEKVIVKKKDQAMIDALPEVDVEEEREVVEWDCTDSLLRQAG